MKMLSGRLTLFQKLIANTNIRQTFLRFKNNNSETIHIVLSIFNL